MKKNFIIILVLLFLAIFISGCLSILPTLEDNLITPGKGRLQMYLTDLSEKYKANDSETYLEVNITISKIEAHIAGDAEETEETEGVEETKRAEGAEETEEVEKNWVTLKEWSDGEEATFNLIELKDQPVLLNEVELAPGKYTQIRLFVIEANVKVEIVNEGSEEDIESGSDEEEVTTGEPSESYEEYDLEIPSAFHTGLKLNCRFEIIEGEETELTIDFDAEKSVNKTGNGNYKLKPTIKVTSIIVNNTTENDNGNE